MLHRHHTRKSTPEEELHKGCLNVIVQCVPEGNLPNTELLGLFKENPLLIPRTEIAIETFLEGGWIDARLYHAKRHIEALEEPL